MLDIELNSVLMVPILISKWECKWWSYAIILGGANLVFFFDEVQAIDWETCPNLVFILNWEKKISKKSTKCLKGNITTLTMMKAKLRRKGFGLASSLLKRFQRHQNLHVSFKSASLNCGLDFSWVILIQREANLKLMAWAKAFANWNWHLS